MSCPTSSLFFLIFLIFSVSFLFSKRSSFHRRFLLPLLHCFCFLHPVSISVALPLSSFFLFSLITVSFSLLLYLSPSLSLGAPWCFLFITHSDFRRQTLYTGSVLDMVLHCLFPHTPNPSKPPQEFQPAFRECHPGASKSEREA